MTARSKQNAILSQDRGKWSDITARFMKRTVTTMTNDKRTEMHACDLISRQAAIEAMRKAKDKSEAHRMLMQLPSAQPEIIHCKDCKYNPNPPECGNAACVLFYGMTDQMGFCHHGERRERE